MIRGILGLSSGTLVARGASAASVFLLAIWLDPSDFGDWATAISAIAIVAGLTNFGEVNGYLSGQGGTLEATRRRTRRMNSVLVLAGLLISLTYLLSGAATVAMLACVASLTIWATGEGDLLYASAVKHRAYRIAVFSQVVGAMAKVGVGVLFAVWTESSIAIAVSIAAGACITAVSLRSFSRLASRHDDLDLPAQSTQAGVGERFSWAVNSWMMTIPLHVGFFVAQFVAAPAVLGIYYLSAQATLAVSAILSGPIAKVALTTLAQTRPEHKQRTATHLSGVLAGAIALGTGVIAAFLQFADRLVSEQWEGALPATAILLASLPARILTPIVDSFQQSNNQWWRSTSLNVLDAIGTGLCALTLLAGDVVVLAIALGSWKIALCSVRMLWSFTEYKTWSGAQTLLGCVFFASVSGATVASTTVVTTAFALASVATGASWVSHAVLRSRRKYL